MKKSITLTVGGEDFLFNPTAELYGEHISAIARGNVSDASNNFVMQSAADESKDGLRALDKQNPGAMIQIASEIMSEFAPKLSIKVKK